MIAEVKRFGFWRRCCCRVQFSPVWFTSAYGYWVPYLNTIRVGRLSLIGLWSQIKGDSVFSHRDVIRHEWGHVVLDKNRQLAVRLGFSRLFGWSIGYSPKSHVSVYAATAPDEDFCETFMLFLKHRGRQPRYLRGTRLRRKWNFIGRMAREFRKLPA